CKMFLDTDTFLLDILFFRSIITAASIYYIYRYTEGYKRHCLFLLVLIVAPFVIGIDIFVC
ncbi:hypothetical protein NDU88_009255, partial [Pleurodeles waltl]